MTSDLNEVPIHRSLTRVVHLAGADRRLTLTNIGLSLSLILMTGFSLWPCVLAITLGTIGQGVLIRISKIDPQIVDIYPRHIRYRNCYRAQPDTQGRAKRPLPSIPRS